MNPMQRYIDYGKTPEGLRHFAHKLLAYNNQFGGGYAICVMDSAAETIERLVAENEMLQKQLNQSSHPTLF